MNEIILESVQTNVNGQRVIDADFLFESERFTLGDDPFKAYWKTKPNVKLIWGDRPFERGSLFLDGPTRELSVSISGVGVTALVQRPTVYVRLKADDLVIMGHMVYRVSFHSTEPQFELLGEAAPLSARHHCSKADSEAIWELEKHAIEVQQERRNEVFASRFPVEA